MADGPTPLDTNELDTDDLSSQPDGSKLLLRLRKRDRVTIDAPLRLLFSTTRLKNESSLMWKAEYVCEEDHNLMAVDSNVIGHRFVAIPLAKYGTIYTKGAACLVVVGPHNRTRVSAQSLPYRTCNRIDAKGEATAMGDRPSPQSRRTDSVVFLRASRSLHRHEVTSTETVTLHSGVVVAWTLGLKFAFKGCCWCRSATAVGGEGTVWIDAPVSAPVSRPAVA
eukprot:Selendium_serpulae@DN6509_c4_g1_i1.p1